MNAGGLIPWADAVFDWTWRTSLHASVLIAIVWLIQIMVGKKLAPHWHYAFGFLVLVRLVVPTVPASEISIFNLGRNYVAPALSSVSAPLSLDALEESEALLYSGPTLGALGDYEATGIEAPPMADVRVIPSPDRSLSAMLKWIWLLGMMAILVRVLLQHRRLSRWADKQKAKEIPRLVELLDDCKAAMGVGMPVKLVVTPDVSTAAVFGLWKPRVLIPADIIRTMTEQDLRFILLHELAHIKRHDTLLNWVMILLQSLHWFNPLVWISMKRLRADRELVCDAMVMKHVAGGKQSQYGTTLIKLLKIFSQAEMPAGLVPVIDSKQEIKRRIVMISRKNVMGRLAQVGALVLLVGVLSLTFTKAVAREGEGEERERHRERAERVERAEREHREQAERGEFVEMEKRLHKMKREIQELREADQHEKAEHLEREAREIAQRLEHARAERRERKEHASRREHREGGERRELAEMEERLHRMKREIHELHEADQHDKAEQLEREARKIAQRLERAHAGDQERGRDREHPENLERHHRALAERAEEIGHALNKLREADGPEADAKRRKLEAALRQVHQQAREIEEHMRGRAHEAERGEIERRMHHMRQAAENLMAAGLEDAARSIMEQAERMEHGREPRREREEPRRDIPPPEQMQRHMAELSEVVRNLHREVRELHEQMNHLRERIER